MRSRTRSSALAEENLQARIRGNILMALSNKFGWLVLTTGNKSEMATGYATLYGDMAGGFAVIKDVPKTLVYELARHRNASPAARSSRRRRSTSRRAPSCGQTSSTPTRCRRTRSSIPILEMYVEDDRSIEEIVAAGYDEALVQRIVQMVDRNEYKRRQAPPGIKITPRAFGRDRRLPIAMRYRPR